MKILANVFWCLVGVAIALMLAYTGFYLFAGVMTGNWAEGFSLGALVSIWFLIPAVFVNVPATIAGYICGLFLIWPAERNSTHDKISSVR